MYVTVSTDVDECKTNNGGCSHTCINEDGCHRCECPEGYQLDFDERTCIGKIEISAFI